MDEDRRLLAEFVRGNSQEAFAQLVRRHVDLVHAAAMRALGDHHQAEDAAQVVFLLLWRKAASLSHEVVVAGWLFTATRRICADLRRAESRQKRREQLTTPKMSESAGEFDWERLAPILNDAVAGLGKSRRDAVVLRFLEDRSYAEIGLALSISEDAAKMRVSRALVRLRNVLSRKGIRLTVSALGAGLLQKAIFKAPAALAGMNPAAAPAGVQAMADAAGRNARFLRRAVGAGILCLFILLAGLLIWRHRPAAPIAAAAPAAAPNPPAAAAAPPAPQIAPPINGVQSGFGIDAIVDLPEAAQLRAAGAGIGPPAADGTFQAYSIDEWQLAPILGARAAGKVYFGLLALQEFRAGIGAGSPQTSSGQSASTIIQGNGPAIVCGFVGGLRMHLENEDQPAWDASISWNGTFQIAQTGFQMAAIPWKIDVTGRFPAGRSILILSPASNKNAAADYCALVAIQIGQSKPATVQQWLDAQR